jgi:nucleoside-diphosphate-sugar epimerase
MLKLAILGANGFIGARAVEYFHLGGKANVRPVVRSFAALARASRFDLDARVADARDPVALVNALKGCDTLLHCAVGDDKTIAKVTDAAYEAAQVAGIKRIVYLSSASVLGQSPKPGSDEESEMSDKQRLTYNNAKVRAERRFLALRAKGSVELVMLRPGIVYGPRSRWISNLAEELFDGTATLVQEGTGIFNGIYVDNLLDAVERATVASREKVDGRVFHVGDLERVTWGEYYSQVAQALGLDSAAIRHVSMPDEAETWREQLQHVRSSRAVQALLPWVPASLKRAVKASLGAIRHREPDHWSLPVKILPSVTVEMALLQQCQWQFPISRAQAALDYAPPVSFVEGVHRSVQWLRFAGYPVPISAVVLDEGREMAGVN